MLQNLKRKLHGAILPKQNTHVSPEQARMTTPVSVTIPMQQHIGAPCDVLCAIGQKIQIGELIGNDAKSSAPIYSSVGGIVECIDTITLPNDRQTQAVVIKTTGEQQAIVFEKPIGVDGRDSFLEAVQTSGIVGLGGAGFPTYMKMGLSNTIDTLIINGAECEPFVESDNSNMICHPDTIVQGIARIMKMLSIEKAVIGIEEDKPDAIVAIKQAAASHPDISVVRLEKRYPQGAEKVIVYEITGRTIPTGMFPSDVDVLVNNVTTILAIEQYLQTGLPLIEKCITIAGDAVQNPRNLIVPIGTSVRDILLFCEVDLNRIDKLILGGPMMGQAIDDLDTPITKTTNAILALGAKQAVRPTEIACMRCSRCVKACPMNLMPLSMEEAYWQEDTDELEELYVMTCIECGSCSFVCPSRRRLVEAFRASKTLLRNKVSN